MVASFIESGRYHGTSSSQITPPSPVSRAVARFGQPLKVLCTMWLTAALTDVVVWVLVSGITRFLA